MTLNPSEEATAVLHDFWWPWEGNDALPVDPVKIARRLGLRVREAELEPDLSGAIFRDPGESTAVILLNESDSENRQRFTCAHEMGHYIKRTEDDPSGQIEFVDRRDALSSKGTNPEEIFANNFAAELLMPEHLVRSYASGEQPVPLWRLAIKFGVSADAMDVRFKNLSIHR